MYEAYGNIVLSTGTSENNRLANTKERDFSIGLDNHGFRYYDAEIGRYISPDPIGYGDGMNMYIYVHCNPINFIDPLGLGDPNIEALDKRISEIEEQIEGEKYHLSKLEEGSAAFEAQEGKVRGLERERYWLRSQRSTLLNAQAGRRVADRPEAPPFPQWDWRRNTPFLWFFQHPLQRNMLSHYHSYSGRDVGPDLFRRQEMIQVDADPDITNEEYKGAGPEYDWLPRLEMSEPDSPPGIPQ